MTKLDLYIFKQSLFGLLISLAGVAISIVMVDLVEQMRAVSGIKGAGFVTATYLTLLRLPGLIEQTVPITILISALITFTGLSRRSEIIAMRAAGISAWRFLAPLGTLAVMLALSIIFIIGPLASKLNREYAIIKNNLISSLQSVGPDKKINNWFNIPVENGQMIITSQKEVKNQTGRLFESPVILVYGNSGLNFLERLDAKTALISKEKVIVTDAIISRAGESPQFQSKREYPITDILSQAENLEPRDLSIWQLPGAASVVKKSHGTYEKFWLRFYKLLALPFMLLAMALFAGLMSIGLDRSGGKGRAVTIALIAGIIMFFSGDVTGILATSGILQPIVAALGPAALALSLTLLFLSYREDGIPD